jgi:hypothetical protein
MMRDAIEERTIPEEKRAAFAGRPKKDEIALVA